MTAALPRPGAAALRGVSLAALLSLAGASALRAQAQPAGTSAGVEIRVVVGVMGRAEVTERVGAQGDSASGASRFRMLTRPCTIVERIAIGSASRTGALRRTASGPWRLLDDSAGIDQHRSDITLRYEVTLEPGARDIPLVVPERAVSPGRGVGAPRVAVVVSLPDAGDRVTFPRMERSGTDGEWRGDFVAVPSFVSLRRAGIDDSCGQVSTARDDGGLSWRFWLLVAILVIWVPTYQWWARRQPEHDR